MREDVHFGWNFILYLEHRRKQGVFDHDKTLLLSYFNNKHRRFLENSAILADSIRNFADCHHFMGS